MKKRNYSIAWVSLSLLIAPHICILTPVVIVRIIYSEEINKTVASRGSPYSLFEFINQYIGIDIGIYLAISIIAFAIIIMTVIALCAYGRLPYTNRIVKNQEV